VPYGIRFGVYTVWTKKNIDTLYSLIYMSKCVYIFWATLYMYIYIDMYTQTHTHTYTEWPKKCIYTLTCKIKSKEGIHFLCHSVYMYIQYTYIRVYIYIYVYMRKKGNVSPLQPYGAQRVMGG
jgi:hypothetical protein